MTAGTAASIDADALIDLATDLRSKDVAPLANGNYRLVGHPKAFKRISLRQRSP